jgi:predicted RNase H-like HicB family nuclease
MITEYPAILFEEKPTVEGDEDVYGVVFPDFPGCVTQGRTLDEARALATEALELHLEGMQEDGDRIPEPSTLELAYARAKQERAQLVVLVAVRVERPVSPATA